MSIKNKMLIPMILVTIIATAAILIVSIFIFSDHYDKQENVKLETYQRVLQNEFEQLKNQSKNASSKIASDEKIIEAITSQDREALIARATELQKHSGVEFCTITDATGIVLGRSHEPDTYGDDIKKQVNVSSAIEGKESAGIEKGTAVKLSVRAGVPCYNNANELIGVISTGFRLDQDSFVDRMKNMLDVEITVFLADERIATTVTKADGTRAIGTKADAAVYEQVLGNKSFSGEAKILDNPAFVAYSPIIGADESIIGMIFSGEFMQDRDRTINNFILRGGLIALIILIIVIPIIIVIARRTVKPIKSMVKAAKSLAMGDLNISMDVSTKDETKALAESFNLMITESREQARIIEMIANGDLSGYINVRSDKDAVNMAINRMLEKNNEMFTDIRLASGQVASGANQIAHAAQDLASGSTEQSAAIENLSTSLSDVLKKVENNAANAEKSLEVTNKAGQLMQGCTESMNEMLDAMSAIDESSKSITKVIKVIEDIAFQTTILALNAAVEAARAGQHGKGFAVVAEEVRNLASKSTEAAQETAALISGSSQRVSEGSQIVERTSKSLTAVGESAIENLTLIQEISKASWEQSRALTDLNEGIDQISTVIHTNSATAQESAAAAQEMSAQAAMLDSIITQFKLNNEPDRTLAGGDFTESLPPGDERY